MRSRKQMCYYQAAELNQKTNTQLSDLQNAKDPKNCTNKAYEF